MVTVSTSIRKAAFAGTWMGGSSRHPRFIDPLLLPLYECVEIWDVLNMAF